MEFNLPVFPGTSAIIIPSAAYFVYSLFQLSSPFLGSPFVTLDDIWPKIQERWSCVNWPRERFNDYLTDNQPRHAVDYYLSSAAAHYNDSAWAALEEQLGPPIIKILQRLPKADFLPDDLWAETRTRMHEEDKELPELADLGRHMARIGRYRGDIILRNYLLVVATRMAFARKRRLHHVKPAMGGDSSTTQDAATSNPAGSTPTLAPDEQAQVNQWAARIATRLPQTFATFNLKHQALLTLIYRDGLPQKEAGRLLGMNESTASRAVKASRDTLRQSLIEIFPDASDPKIIESWEQAWQSCLKNVQVPPSRASDT